MGTEMLVVWGTELMAGQGVRAPVIGTNITFPNIFGRMDNSNCHIHTQTYRMGRKIHKSKVMNFDLLMLAILSAHVHGID